jgi:hypothetical protein
MHGSTRFTLSPTVRRTALALLFVIAMCGLPAAAGANQSRVAANPMGMLDCNGFSPIQQSLKPTMACTDPRAIYESDGARFIDNGHYIGHDEPSVRFLSSKPGSGNDVTWTETLPKDPKATPTVATPGRDITHWFELSVAPWFGMALCDQYSYPQSACKPNSDTNAPSGGSQGGGSSFLEVQFYPPGYAPFFDNISCDNSHWCASLHINDLECSGQFNHCNPNCEEPTNFAFIQRDGVPTGPAGPQVATLATVTPNAQTLLMNPGDRIRVHIFDSDLAGGDRALEVHIDDLSTGQSGFMQAAAANGFMATILGNCKGVPFNYEPEYDTANANNIVPWAALLGGILTQYEIGHFTPCTSLSNPATGSLLDITAGDPFSLTCNGPYEAVADSGSTNPEPPGGDAFCYPAGDTHTALNQFGITSDPNLITGCLDFLAGGDLDFDGTPYRTDWPDSTKPDRFPSTFLQDQPTTGGSTYPQVQFETDAPASESTCSPTALANCTVTGPNYPGAFYPYFTQASVGGRCEWEFGQMANGNTFGGAAQYGPPTARFFGTDASDVLSNAITC